MGLPDMEVIFKTVAQTLIKRTNGTVALILKDTVPATNPVIMKSTDDILESLSDTNKKEIERVFIGNKMPPDKVISYIIPTASTDYSTAQNYFETVLWDYIAVPSISADEVTAFANWIKDCRDNKKLRVKAVLPHVAADYEGVINFATDDIKVGSNTYTAAEYCGRIAGILAGTPLSMSATYSVLSEVDDVPHHIKSEFDAAINSGQLVLINDGEKVKVARAVNSLVTVTADKNAELQKIKIVVIMDKIHDDIKRTSEDNYIGKVPNGYDDKCILITAINAYLKELEDQGLLQKGTNSVSIDIGAQKEYLENNNINTSSMKDQDIKEANTGSFVFLTGNAKILDAMEDIALDLFM